MRVIDEALKKEILELYDQYGVAETARRLHIQYERCKKVIVEAGEWKTPRNAKKYDEFVPELPKGRKFIQIYMDGYGDGLQLKLAKEFDLSVPTAYRIRKRLSLPNIHSKEHPGRRKFYKRVKRLYVVKERSTIQIAKIVRLSSQRINQILREQGVEIRPQHVTNCLYFKTKSKLSHCKLLSEIKRLYSDEKMPIKRIAKKLRIDQGTVSNKLKAMGFEIKIRSSNKNPSGTCVWCNAFIEHLYIAKGPKKQKFCSRTCKNRCKDLRRGPSRSAIRFEKLALEFKGHDNKLGLRNSILRQVIAIRNSVAQSEPAISRHRKLEKVVEAIA